MSAVEIPEITYARVEKAYRLTKEWRATGHDNLAALGMRAARSRDPKLLKAMEQATEILVAENERQLGEYQRQASTDFSQKVIPTEVQMFREAYSALDRGTPEPALCWMYAAGAWLAGFI
jgi:hypothetical protein